VGSASLVALAMDRMPAGFGYQTKLGTGYVKFEGYLRIRCHYSQMGDRPQGNLAAAFRVETMIFGGARFFGRLAAASYGAISVPDRLKRSFGISRAGDRPVQLPEWVVAK
jgi:hypothetical protein